MEEISYNQDVPNLTTSIILPHKDEFNPSKITTDVEKAEFQIFLNYVYRYNLIIS